MWGRRTVYLIKFWLHLKGRDLRGGDLQVDTRHLLQSADSVWEEASRFGVKAHDICHLNPSDDKKWHQEARLTCRTVHMLDLLLTDNCWHTCVSKTLFSFTPNWKFRQLEITRQLWMICAEIQNTDWCKKKRVCVDGQNPLSGLITHL